MRLTLESTEEIVELQAGPRGDFVSARVWTGQSEAGVPVVVWIARVLVPKTEPDESFEAFERELIAMDVRPATAVIPNRFVV